MAARRKRKKKIKFGLTVGAITGIGVIAFCLFLWMFLLGVWTGQSLLLPSYGRHVGSVKKRIHIHPLKIRVGKRIKKKID